MAINRKADKRNIYSKLFKRSPLLFIGLSFALIISMMVSLVVLSISQLGAIHSELENVLTSHNAKIELVQTLRYLIRERMISMHQLVIEDDPFLRGDIIMHFDSQANQFVEARNQLRELAKNDTERGMLDELQKLAVIGTPNQQAVVELLEKNDMAGARKLLKQRAMPAQLNIVRQCDNMLKYYKQVAGEVEREARESQRRTIWMLLLLGAGAAWISIVTAMTVWRRTRKDREDLSIAATAFEAKEGMLIIDVRNLKLRVNQAFTKITGYTATEAIEQIPNMLVSGQHDETFYASLWESINREGGWQGEIWNRRKNGEEYPCWLTVTAVKNMDGKVSNHVAMFTDITERKRAEAELIDAKEEAERANKAKSQFISSMSHELRTPLNAILGFGQLLELESDLLTQEHQESVNYILSSGQQLLGLINEILDLSRIEAGKMELNMHPLCIANIALSCIDQVAVAMGKQRNITFHNTLIDTNLMVYGDDLRLRQILINLLSNAVKYNKNNGQVTISGVILSSGRLRIEVRDTGIGIARDNLPLLFTPFERIDQKHGNISGVGIGLYISKQLVEAMHGTVGVDSEQGKGSTFWFELPLIEAARQLTVASEKLPQPTWSADSRFVVLLVEDNPVNVVLIRKAFQSRPGIELLVAGSAEEGLSIAQEACPNLILMDLNLPGIDGVTATAILKETDATRHIAVVALSANATKEKIQRALSSGCSAYLTKPVQLQELYEVVDRVRMATLD